MNDSIVEQDQDMLCTTFTILTVTYNVNGKEPSDTFHELLGFNQDFYGQSGRPDLIAIGLQEAPIFVLQDDPWIKSMDKVVFPFDYIRVKSERMNGISLIFYSKRNLINQLRELHSTIMKFGPPQHITSKGAVSISVRVSGVSLVIVVAHLTPHLEKNESRIKNYLDIIDGLKYLGDQSKNVLSHDYAIFMGDLNFRLDGISAQDVESKVTTVWTSERHRRSSIQQLLEFDQFLQVRQSGQAFSEFCDPEISFLPTYKFEIGTNRLDLSRVPSWTDRILFRFTPNAYEMDCPNLKLDMKVIKYQSHPTYKISDHKPVSAVLKFRTFTRQVYEQIRTIPEPSRIHFLPINWRTSTSGGTDIWFASSAYELSSDDFVAIVRDDFKHLDEDLLKCPIMSSLTPIERAENPPKVHLDLLNDGQIGQASGHSPSIKEWYRITIPFDQSLPPGGSYRVLYCRSQFHDILGISPPFDISK